MKEKTKKRNIKKAVALSVVCLFFLTTVTTIQADDQDHAVVNDYNRDVIDPVTPPISTECGDLPDDITVSSLPAEEGDIDSYPDLGIFDGFQLRQSLFWVMSNWQPRGPYGRLSLVGWKDNFVLYFPIGETHDLALEGYLKVEYVDGTIWETDSWYHRITWANNGFVPYLMRLQCSFSSTLPLKRIEYDVNYFEDDQYVRHIHRVFIDPTYIVKEAGPIPDGMVEIADIDG